MAASILATARTLTGNSTCVQPIQTPSRKSPLPFPTKNKQPQGTERAAGSLKVPTVTLLLNKRFGRLGTRNEKPPVRGDHPGTC
jgi:hypothetical protein